MLFNSSSVKRNLPQKTPVCLAKLKRAGNPGDLLKPFTTTESTSH